MATAAGHTQFTTTKENENYARLSRAIVDWMTFILRELLTFYILPLDIERKSRPFQSTKLKNLRQEQWDLIQKASTDGYFNFDITLLYALLRNLCTSVPKPSKQWGTNDLPEHHQVTLGDDIERIRIVKNSLQSHIPTTKLNDTEFEGYWKILRDVCVRLDSKFNKKYTDGLDNLKTICMDSTLHKKYNDNLKLLRDWENEYSIEIKENTGRIEKNTRQIAEHTSQIKENASQIQDNTSQIQDNTSQIQDNASQIQDNTSQIQDNTSQIQDNTSQIQDNTSRIQDNTSQIQDNTSQIQDNTSRIQDNTSQIQDNTSQIQEHYCQIQDNTSQIQDNTSQIQEHSCQIQDNASQIKDNTSQIQDNTSQIQDNTSQIQEHSSQIQGMNVQIVKEYNE